MICQWVPKQTPATRSTPPFRERSDTNFCKYKPTSPHIPASQPSLFKLLSRTAACLPRPRQHLSHRTKRETLSTWASSKDQYMKRSGARFYRNSDWVDEPSESINSEGVPIHVVQSSRKNRKIRKKRDLRITVPSIRHTGWDRCSSECTYNGYVPSLLCEVHF